MVNFSYLNPTQIEFGTEKEKIIGDILKSHNIKKVLLTYGSERIKNDGLYDTVTNSLSQNGIAYISLGGIVSNPILSKVYEGIQIAKDNNIDAILSVGGGSVLDSTKAMACGSVYSGDVWDFFCGKEMIQSALPVYCILTLSATGSEMNPFAVVTNETTQEKFSIISHHIYPKVSILNPMLQKSVSKEYLAYSASDIIAHSIEGYFTAKVHPTIISKYIEANISTIMQTTNILLANSDDYDARAEFAWAGTQALNGTTYLGVGGFSYPNHMIEHSLSALYNIPHGAGLSVIIPAWMRWYYKQNEAQFTRFANVLFGKSTPLDGIEALEKWFDTIGTPTRLSHLGIKPDEIDMIVQNALKNAIHFGIDKEYTQDVIKEILTLAI